MSNVKLYSLVEQSLKFPVQPVMILNCGKVIANKIKLSKCFNHSASMCNVDEQNFTVHLPVIIITYLFVQFHILCKYQLQIPVP